MWDVQNTVKKLLEVIHSCKIYKCVCARTHTYTHTPTQAEQVREAQETERERYATQVDSEQRKQYKSAGKSEGARRRVSASQPSFSKQ
jgi:hypothetical protein